MNLQQAEDLFNQAFAAYENKDFDGLVNWVTCSAPHNLCIDGCTSYGDFFLLEALMRYTNPDWVRYW